MLLKEPRHANDIRDQIWENVIESAERTSTIVNNKYGISNNNPTPGRKKP